MDTDVKLSYHPSDLSYYTTWWLLPVSSISSRNTTLSGLDDDIIIETYPKKQKIVQTRSKSTCCISMKMFRLKLKKKHL